MSAITTGPRQIAAAGHSRPGRLPRLLRGPAAQPPWARPALLALLALTALLYAAGLSRNGWANDFYSAAVQAGTKSWKAFFFGSFDASSFITVDKTPASLWVMELSARVFGPELLERPAAAGRRGCRVGRSPLRRGSALVRARSRAHRRRGARDHPGGHADVPVQQPRRAAGAADDGGRLRHGPRHRVRPDPVDRAGGGPARVRLPDQDAPGVPGSARVRPGLPGGRAAEAGAAHLAVAGRRGGPRRRGGLVGGDRAVHPGRPGTGLTSGARPTTASCSWPWATTGWAGSTATRPGRWASTAAEVAGARLAGPPA